MRKIFLGLSIALLAVLVLAGAFSGGWLVGTLTAKSAAPTSNMLDYALLDQVLGLLRERYYGEIPDDTTLAYGAINGLLLTLEDPNTVFIEPNVARIMREDSSGQFEGIGATVQMRADGYLEVVRLLPDQPAEAAGLQAGDLIAQVDGQSIEGMGLYEALGLIRGPAGTQVMLNVLRPATPEPIPLTFTITRKRIDLPILEYEMLEGDIAYIRLLEFDAGAGNRMKTALTALLAENPMGVVLDLRNNPGGYLHEASNIADLFLDKGVVLIQRNNQGRERIWRSTDGDLGEQIPLVVLVNGYSASASELVAGAFQDRERAHIIGEQTYGKGSVQRVHDLSDGSQLRVTNALWFTPNDQAINGVGITPDLLIPYPTDTSAGEDPQLQRAIEYLQAQSTD